MADTEIKASLEKTTATGPGPRDVPSLNLNNIPMGQWDALLARGPWYGSYGYGQGYPRAGVQPGSPFSPGIGGAAVGTGGQPGYNPQYSAFSGGGGGFAPAIPQQSYQPPQPMDVRFEDPGISRASMYHPINMAQSIVDDRQEAALLEQRNKDAAAVRQNRARFPYLTPLGEGE